MDLVMDAILSTVSDRRVESTTPRPRSSPRRASHARPSVRAHGAGRCTSSCATSRTTATCYLVSGGDRDLMRPISAEYYGIPVDQVIGSAVGVSYDADANELRYGGRFEIIDDGVRS